MGLRRSLKKVIESTGYTITKVKPTTRSLSRQRAVAMPYNQDGLYTIHNHDFMGDPSFVQAYERGIAAGEADYHWHWRVHAGLWAAFSASKLEGDFVECGVNRGFLSSAIMEHLNWDSLGKTFYLLDTFAGIDARFVTEEELTSGILRRNERKFYTKDVESVKANFSEWRNVRIVVGAVPETLSAVTAEKIAYLHLDMNCAPPEVAALEHFWDRLAPGAFILFDDYAYQGYEPQKAAHDAFAQAKGMKILSIPTGQGLLIKPA